MAQPWTRDKVVTNDPELVALRQLSPSIYCATQHKPRGTSFEFEGAMQNPNQIAKTEWMSFLILAILLIANAVWRVVIPGGEWPMSPTHYLSMGINVVMLGGLVVTNMQLTKILPRQDSRRTTMKLLFIPAVIAGCVLLLIRVTSKSAWWTGHLF